MGYFDGLVSGSLKKDTRGRTVFYPMGVLARGRVLPDDASEQRVRSFMLRYCMVGLPIAVLAGLFAAWWLTLIAVAALLGWFFVGTKGLLADCPYSDEKMTLKEGYTNSAKAHNPVILWILLVSSLLFTLVALVAVLRVDGTGPTLLWTGIAVLFGATSAAMAYMLRARRG